MGRGQSPPCWVRISSDLRPFPFPRFCKLATSSLRLQLSSPEAEAPAGTSTQQPTRWRSGSSQTPRAAVEDSGPTSLRASAWAHPVLDLGASPLSGLACCQAQLQFMFFATSSVCRRRVPVSRRRLYPR